MQNFLLYWTTGYYFYIGLLCIVLGLATSFFDNKKLFKIATRVLMILGFAFVALSAAPMSGFFFRTMGLMTLTLFFGLTFFNPISGPFVNILRTIIIFMCWSAMNTQLGYDNIPQTPIRSCEKLIIVGSSLSFSDDNIQCWGALLQEKYNIQVINLSRKGALLNDLLEKVDLISQEKIVVLIEGGFEDIKRDVPYMEYKQNYFDLCRKLEHKRVYFFMTGIPVRLFERQFSVIQRDAKNRHGGIIIPNKKIVNLITNKKYSLDGRILTQDGHTKMSEIIWNIIFPLFQDRES